MIVEIPLQPVPSQAVQVALNGQPCLVTLRQLDGRQYLSLSVNGTVMCQNVLLQDRSYVVRAPYLGLVGDVAAVDTQGADAPAYTGWGTRWRLLYNPDAFV